MTLTALTALCIAIAIAHRRNQSLNQMRAELLAMSGRLQITDEDQLTQVALPKVAYGFQTWDLHVPKGPAFELRLGVGEVSESGIPAEFDRVSLSAGRHRVTLQDVVSSRNGNRFVVYLDGEQVIEKTPGPDWMAHGWSSASGLGWPRRQAEGKHAPLQLAGKSYVPKLNLGKSGNFNFNGSDDSFVTSPGFRLWIDQPGRTYRPASPFIGFGRNDLYRGIGLRDGFRFKANFATAYELVLIRPKSRADDPVLRIIPEFIADGKTVLSAQTPTFRAWQLRSEQLHSE